MDIGSPPSVGRRSNQKAPFRQMTKNIATATDPAHKSGSDHEFQYQRYLDIELNGAYAVWHRWRCGEFDNRENRDPSLRLSSFILALGIEIAMNIQLEVVPLRDNQSTSASELVLYHSECRQAKMVLRRDAVGVGCILRCGCGLQLDLPEKLVSAITYAAIDAQPRILNLSDSVTVQLSIREVGS